MKKHLCALLAALFLLSCAAAETATEAPAAEETVPYSVIYSSENPIPQIAADVRPAVVQVWSYVESWDPITRVSNSVLYGCGSGTYIRATDEGGFILTNNHVIDGCDAFKIIWLDGTEMDAVVRGRDDGTDIAILEFTQPAPEGVKVVPMGDSDALQIGELAIAIGNPGAGKHTLTATVTAGIISGVERAADFTNFTRGINVIQTDAAINTGNSGGALLNAKGELVGIPANKFMFSADAVYEGLGFCVPINTVKEYIDQLIEKGSVVRPRMGMMVIAVDGPDEPMHKYPPAGMSVVSVEIGGPAAKAGLQAGDIVTEVNGVRVFTFAEMSSEMDKCGEGDKLHLKVYRYAYDETGNITGDFEALEFDVKLEVLDN